MLLLEMPNIEALNRLSVEQLWLRPRSHAQVTIRLTGKKKFLALRVYNLLVSKGVRTHEDSANSNSSTGGNRIGDHLSTDTFPISSTSAPLSFQTKTSSLDNQNSTVFSSSTPWSQVSTYLLRLKALAIPLIHPQYTLLHTLGCFPYSLQHMETPHVEKFWILEKPPPSVLIIARMFSNLKSDISWTRFRTPRVNSKLIDPSSLGVSFAQKASRLNITPPLDITPFIHSGENKFSFHLPYQPGLLVIQRVQHHSLEDLIKKIPIYYSSPQLTSNSRDDLLNIKTKLSLKCPLSLREFTPPPSIIEYSREYIGPKPTQTQLPDPLPVDVIGTNTQNTSKRSSLPPRPEHATQIQLNRSSLPPRPRPSSKEPSGKGRVWRDPLDILEQWVHDPRPHALDDQTPAVHSTVESVVVGSGSRRKAPTNKIPTSWYQSSSDSSSESDPSLRDEEEEEVNFGTLTDKSPSDSDSDLFDGEVDIPGYTFPCRGKNCTHKQPVSAGALLQHFEITNCFHCPECDKRVPFEDLFIDGDFSLALATIDTTRPDFDPDVSYIMHDSSTGMSVVYSDPRTIKAESISGLDGAGDGSGAVIELLDEDSGSSESEGESNDPHIISVDTSAWEALSDDDGFEIIN